MSARARLFRALVARHLSGHRARTALTVLGVALGVAVVVAINASSRVALEAFAQSADAIAGDARLRVRVDGVDLGERALETLSPLWEDARLDPALFERGHIGTPDGESIEILGINMLADARLAAAEPLSADNAAFDASANGAFLDRFLDPRAVIVGRRFAARLGVEAGDSIAFHWGSQQAALHVRGVFPDSGAFLAFGGNIAVMDIAAFQTTLGRAGRLSWIDITPRDGVAIEHVETRARALLGDGYVIEPPGAAAGRLAKMVSAYRMNLLALGGIAALVGLFLVYNTISSSILSRREEIAVLRALGATRRQVAWILAGESALVGVAGSIAGLFLSAVLARGTVAAVSATIYRVYGAVRPEMPTLTGRDALIAIVLGVTLSIVASIEPLLLAFRVRPLEFLRERRPSRSPRRYRAALAGVATILLAAAATRANPIGGAPLFGYLSALLLLVGLSLCLPAMLFALAGLAGVLSRRVLSVSGRVAAAAIGASVGRHAVAAAALMVAIGMVVGMAILVESFEHTILAWARQSLRADLWVEPAARTPGTLEGTFDARVADRVAALPSVEAVDSFRGIQVVVEGGPVTIGAGDVRVLAARGELPMLGGESAAAVLPRLAGADRIVASEPFALKRGARRGDVVRIPTPRGEIPFIIEGIYRDYSSDRGYLVMDRARFVEYFGDESISTIAVYLKAGADLDSARTAIIDATSGEAHLKVFSTGTIRKQIERTLRGTFALTYALTAIGLVVAMLAVSTTLAIVAIEDRRTIGVLKALGAGRRQILRMTLAQALLLGVFGSASGLAAGFALAWILVYVINLQSFGWALSYSVPWPGLVALAAGVPVVAGIAGYFPARRAALTSPRLAMSRD
ncbi:MAG: FtsX-like permease family protein [bacterium]